MHYSTHFFKGEDIMRETALVVMAAGIGSRFGTGIKQLTPVGQSGEIIIDYSVFDAMEAGFNKVVFIIRKDLEEVFKEVIGDRLSKVLPVSYAFQETDNLPEGFTKPADRIKPWGTGQAVLACKDIVDCPFVVINADDYYGKEAFKAIHDYLVSVDESKVNDYCMAGFILGNTLSDNGAVTRGVCFVDENQYLTDIRESFELIKADEKTVTGVFDNQKIEVAIDSFVSMNMWGFFPSLFDELEARFIEFLKGIKDGDIKKEYLLPTVVGNLLAEEKISVKVLPTNDKWFGVTYAEDKEVVVNAFKQMHESGKYNSPLFEKK